MGAADGSHGQTWQLARAAVFYRPFVDDVNFPSCFSLLSLFGEALCLPPTFGMLDQQTCKFGKKVRIHR